MKSVNTYKNTARYYDSDKFILIFHTAIKEKMKVKKKKAREHNTVQISEQDKCTSTISIY